MSIFTRLLAAIVFAAFCVLLLVGEARADVSCNVDAQEIPHYIDAATETCRTSGDHPDSGVMIRKESGSDYVMMDVSYAAGNGVQEPNDLQCIEGVCGVGRPDDEGDAGNIGERAGCEGDCRVSFSYRDEFDNPQYVELVFTQSTQRIVATLSGNTGPPSEDRMTVDVPATISAQNGPFEVDFRFSELAERSDGQPASEGLPLVVDGGVLDRTQVLGTNWRVRITPTREGVIELLLPYSSMIGSVTGNLLAADYRVRVPVDMTPPLAELVYSGRGQGDFSEVFRFRSNDPMAQMNGKPEVTVSGLEADVEVLLDEELIVVTTQGPGEATLTLEAGLFVDMAGNVSTASQPLTHEFGNHAVDVVSLTASPAQDVPFASDVELTAELSVGISQGAVDFFIDGSRKGRRAVSEGRAVFVTPVYEPGEVEVEARFYAGAAPGFEAGSSATILLKVVKGTPGLTIASAPGTSSVNGEVEISGEVIEDYAGTVRLEAALDGGPFTTVSAQIERTFEVIDVVFVPEQAGTYRLRLVAPETPYFNAEISNEVEVRVEGRAASGTLSLDAAQYSVGERPTLTAAVSPNDATGQVIFYRDQVEIGRVSISSGTATLRAPELSSSGQALYGATYVPTPTFVAFDFDPVSVEVVREQTGGTLSSDKERYAHGERAVLSASIESADATGDVEFSLAGEVIGTAPLVQGLASIQTEAFEANGYFEASARYLGNSAFAAFEYDPIQFEVSSSATSLELSAYDTSVIAGTPTRLSAQIAPASATGVVAFFEEDVEIGYATLSSGGVEIDHIFETAGQRRLHARYQGQTGYSPSTSPTITVDVRKSHPMGSFAVSPREVIVGDEISMNVVFSTDGVEGAVEFLVDGEIIDRPMLSNGAAEVRWATRDAGPARIEARYLGSDRFEGVDFAPVDLIVSPRTVTGSIMLDRNAYTVGERGLARVEIMPTSANGQVSFQVDGTEVGRAAISDGIAEFELPKWERSGTSVVAAFYHGDANHEAGALGSTEAEVAKASVFLSLEVLGGPFEVGDEAALAVDVTPAGAEGTVTFLMDGASLGSVSLSSGRAEVHSLSFDRSGQVTFEARFDGNEGYEPTSTTPSIVEVAPRTAVLGLSVAGDGATEMLVDEATTLVARLSETGSGGFVRLMRDGVEQGSAVLNGAEARFEVDSSQAGSFRYQAIYEGDAKLASAQSGFVDIIVSKRRPSVDLRITPAQPEAGGTAYMRAILGEHVEGMISFENDGSSVGAAAVVAGEAVAPLLISEGDYRLVARFTPDESRAFEATSSAPLVFSVGKRLVDLTWSSSGPQGEIEEAIHLEGSVSDQDYMGDILLMQEMADGEVRQIDRVGVVNGRFSFTYRSAQAGEFHLWAETPVNETWATARSGSLVVRVEPREVQGVLELLPARVELDGQSVARVTLFDPNAEGRVEFSDDGVSIGSVEIGSGTAEVSLTSRSIGTRQIEARYSGSDRHAALVLTPQNFEVVRQQGYFSLEADKDDVIAGDIVRLTMRSRDHADLSGSVVFLANGERLGAASMQDGIAFLDIASGEPGTFSLTGRFEGSSRVAAGDAADAVAITVRQVEAALSLLPSASQAVVGEWIDLTAHITPDDATGMIRFVANGEILEDVGLTNGEAVLAYLPETSGEVMIEAHYLAGGSHGPANAEPVSIQVAKRSVEARLSSDATRYDPGSSARLTLTLSRSDAAGMAEFFHNGSSIGMAQVVSGAVSIGVPLQEAGPHSFTANYLGDDRHAPVSASEAITVEVTAPQGGQVSLAPLPPEVFVGAEVEFSGSAEMPDGVAGTGEVILEIDRGDGFEVLLRAPHDAGRWSAETSFPREESMIFRARLDAGSSDGGAIYSALREMSIVRRHTGIALTAAPQEIQPNQEIVMTAEIAPTHAQGEVVFFVDELEVGRRSLVNGGAELAVSLSDEGTHKLRAEYAGNDTYEGSTSQRVDVVVGRAGTALSVAGSFDEQGDALVLNISATMTPAIDGAELGFLVSYENAAGDLEERHVRHATSAGHAQVALVLESRPAEGSLVELAVVFEETATHLGSEARATFASPSSPSPEPELILTNGVFIVSPDLAAPGEDIALKLSITPDEATGRVVFRDGGETIGSAMLENGAASMTISFDAEGSHDVSAFYEGDAAHADWSSQPWRVEVARDMLPTQASLTADRESYEVGDTAQLAFTLSEPDATGEVIFALEGQGELARVPLSNGLASTEVELAEAGHLRIQARYTGDDRFLGSVAEVTVSAGRMTVSGRMDASREQAAPGEPVSLSVDLEPRTAMGEVVFRTHQGVIGSSTLEGGRAEVELVFDQAGRFEIFAQYEGDDTHAAWAASEPVAIEVVEDLVETSARLSTDKSTYELGDLARLTFSVSPASATGEVIFEAEGEGVFATALLDGGQAVADLPLGFEGHVRVLARYVGDDRFADSSAETIISAGRVAVSGNFAASSERVAPGSSVVLDLQVTPQEATGRVVFRTEASVVGTAELVQGHASYEARFDEEGRFEVFAQYEGDDTHAAWAASEPIAIEVIEGLVETSARLSADRSAYDVGDEARLVFEISPSSATGEVIFETEGLGIFATVPIDGGQASANLPLGSEGHVRVLARYVGSDRFEESSAETIVSAARAEVSGSMTLDREVYSAGEMARLEVEMTPENLAGNVVLLADGVEVERRVLDAGKAGFLVQVPQDDVVMLQAVYEGSDTYGAWMSEQLGLRAGERRVKMSLVALEMSAMPGEAVAFRLSITPSPATGAAEIEANGEIVRTIPLVGRDDYEFDLPMPDSGDLWVIARFEGAGGYPASASSQIVVEQTDRADSTISLSLSDAAPQDGQTITLTGRVAPNTASGQVSFEVSGTVVARAPLSSGRADAVWTVPAGEQRIVARYEGDQAYRAAVSEQVVVSVRTLAAELFEERRAFIEDIMNAEAERANGARARGFERRMDGVRGRLRGETGQGIPRGNDDAGAEWSNGEWQPFRYQGDIRATDGFAHGDGAFSSRRKLGGTGVEQFVDGGFEVTRRSDLGTSFEGAVNTGIERRLSEDAIVGATVGLEMAQTAIDSEMSGEMQSLGVNAGIYGAKRIGGDVVVDGYANAARTHNDLDLSDDELKAEASYGATTLQVGGSVGGRYEVGRTEFLPAVTLRHSMTARDRASVDLEARTGPATGEIESRVSHETRVEIVPEMRFHSRRENGPVLSVKPKVICEREEGTECGVGLGAGVEVPVVQGRGKLKAGVSVEQVGDEVEERIFFGFEIKF